MPSAVRLDDPSADRQPQPQPARPPRPGVVPLLEGVEDPGERLRVDPDAGVGHLQDQPPARPAALLVAGADRHDPAGRGELHRVQDQVAEHLPEPRPVGLDVRPARPGPAPAGAPRRPSRRGRGPGPVAPARGRRRPPGPGAAGPRAARDTSSRSSMSRASTSTPRRTSSRVGRSPGSVPGSSSRAVTLARTGVSGVRSSWDRAARNRSRARPAASARASRGVEGADEQADGGPAGQEQGEPHQLRGREGAGDRQEAEQGGRQQPRARPAPPGDDQDGGQDDQDGGVGRPADGGDRDQHGRRRHGQHGRRVVQQGTSPHPGHREGGPRRMPRPGGAHPTARGVAGRENSPDRPAILPEPGRRLHARPASRTRPTRKSTWRRPSTPRGPTIIGAAQGP